MDLITIDSLNADIKAALDNKKIASVDQWMASQSGHGEASCQLLRVNDVKKLTTLSKSTIALWVAQSRFPKPIPLSLTVKVWRLSDIKIWLDQKAREIEEELNAEPSIQFNKQLGKIVDANGNDHFVGGE
jgi:predicted DNA-binding transcriptional regulator AlpA